MLSLQARQYKLLGPSAADLPAAAVITCVHFCDVDLLFAAGVASGLPLLLAAAPVHAGQQKITVSNLSVFQKASQLQFLVVRPAS